VTDWFGLHGPPGKSYRVIPVVAAATGHGVSGPFLIFFVIAAVRLRIVGRVAQRDHHTEYGDLWQPPVALLGRVEKLRRERS
jgi:hypothetical protein